jgi:hypothetical protein
MKLDPEIEKFGKWLDSRCPTCKGCPVQDKCIETWDRMVDRALNPTNEREKRKIIISYRPVFLELIKEKDLIKSMSYRPRQARVE